MSKRVDQKQAAKVVRDQLARERRRQRALWVGVVAASVLVIAGLAGWFAIASGGDDYEAPPGVAAGDDSGITMGSGPIKIDLYADFICPACGAYESATKSTMDKLIEENKITLIFHPVAFLDDQSSTDYSTRASGAAACASEGGKFREYVNALFANQPEEGTAGLSDDDLVRIGNEIGLSSPDFGTCVKDGKYKDWTSHVSDKASERGVTGTPTIYVNGKQVKNSLEALNEAVAAAGK